MKHLFSFRRALYIAAMITLTCALVIGVSLWRTAAVRDDPTTAGKERFKASVRDGVGREVRFGRNGDDRNSVRASVESAVQFMRKRSGVDLRGQTKTRLADMETRVLAGASRRITTDELSEILAATAVERIAVANDEEIGRAVETLRGFDAPDLPSGFRNSRAHVRLRASAPTDLTPEQLTLRVKAVRAADPITRELLKIMVKRAVGDELQKRTKSLGETVPEQFGAVASEGYTPLQAVLIAYSVASDDLLADSADNLQRRLKGIHDGIERLTGQPYPRSEGHFAYGPNGYL